MMQHRKETSMVSKIFPQGSTGRKIVRDLFSFKIPEHLSQNFRILEPSVMAAIETELRENYYIRHPSGFLKTEQGKHDFQAQCSGRLEKARKRVVPWLDQISPLAGASILEIGSGTGSASVAFAEQGAHVTAVDVEKESLEIARKRCECYGIQDVRFITANATKLHTLLAGERFDFIIFYAVLEHMTHEERMLAMSSTWEMLASGAFWCVTYTPNRLWYYDAHTSKLPFFNWLPDALAFEYSQFSPRPRFKELYREQNEANMLHFLRRGRGVSFHEFELTLGKVDHLDVVSSMSRFYRQRSILKSLQWRFSEESRYESFLAQTCPHIHRGFFQRLLELAIRKR